ncbi:serine hydrolase [Streptomyces sp. x-80]|uniref:serine hydrolase n=1 Tax=Streptomyces sp. x-80 TaxID=2789282 RepID=UPI00398162C6
MAGESPDKSGRKQPSGETARSERDPRLAVFRREPDEVSAGEPADGSAQRSEAAQGATVGAVGTVGTPGGGDRPRGATAARTAPTDDGDGNGGNGDGGDGDGGDGDGGAGGPVGAARMAGDGDDDAVAKPGAKPAMTAEKKAEKKVEAKAEATPENGPEAGPKGEPAAVTAGAELGAETGAKAAVAEAVAGSADGDADVDGAADAAAAVVAGGAKSEAGAEAKSGTEVEPGAGARSAGGAEDGVRGDEPAPEAVDKATAVFATLGAQKSGGKGRSAGQSQGKGKGKAEDEGRSAGQGRGEGAGAALAEGADDEASVDTVTRTFTIAKSKANGAAKGGGATEDQAEQPVDQPTAIFKIAPSVGDKPVGGKSGDKSDGLKPGADDAESAGSAEPVDGGKAASGKSASGGKASKTTSKSGSGEAGNGEGADSEAKDSKAEDSEAKDRGKESRQGKDGGSEGDGAEDADGARAAERDAERTSQFVALKSADTGAAERSLGKTADRAPGWAGAAALGKASDKASDKDSGEQSSPAAKDKDATSGAKPSAAVTGATAAAVGDAAPTETGASAAAQPKAGSGALPDSERTRQEPLPPLDLLAKLTNTPPPPETKLRTTVRRFKIWTPLAVLLAIIFVVVQAVRPVPAPKLAVGAEAAFTFKGGELNLPWPDQGQATAEVVGVGSLGTSGQEKPVPTASVAKVMTAYVILRDHPLKKKEQGEPITIDAKAEADSKKGDESRVPVKEGQKFSEYQMLQMLMIPSGNNAARQLARWDAQSEEAFVKKMNDAAKQMGMTKTTYTDPSGLDEKTVSTPADQLKLAEQVIKNDVFREIVAMENVKIEGLPETLYANNSLLTTMPGVVRGIKTGSSSAAGGAFMWVAYRTVGGETQTLLGVTMGQHTTSKDSNAHLALALKNSEKVIKAVRDALVSDTVVKKGQVVGYVDDGLGGRTPVVATKDLKAVGWPGMKATFSMGNGGKAVPHTAKAGTEIGVLTVGNGESVQKVPVALQKDLVEPTFGAKLTRIS